MKIKRQELVDILAAVRPGLAKKAIIEQATHFIITGNEIVTYNDRVCVSHPFKTDFSCSVSAEELYKILVGISHEEIDIQYKNQKIYIRGKGLDAGLTTSAIDDIVKKVESLKINEAAIQKTSLPENFVEAINMCIFSTSKDLTNVGMTCLLLEDEYIASTDDLRISEYKMKSKIDCSILLPVVAAIELVRYNIKEYCLIDSWVYFFDASNTCFCARLVRADFPEYKPFMEGFNDQKIQFPDNIIQMIETTSILASGETEQDKEVEIEIVKGMLKIKSKNNIGWIENEIEISNANFDNSIQFAINPFFMAKIMNHTKTMFYGGNKALFQSGEFRHVIALRAQE